MLYNLSIKYYKILHQTPSFLRKMQKTKSLPYEPMLFFVPDAILVVLQNYQSATLLITYANTEFKLLRKEDL